MTRSGEYGFTLLEMLVALTVFALVSAMVYGGQMAVLSAKEKTERQARFLKQAQITMMMLEQDISQHLLRSVRDEFGDKQPPMVSADYGEYRLSLTREGWQNPMLLPRSSLQRVAYGVQDKKLMRYGWMTLDRVQGSEPYKVVLLEQVNKIYIRFLNQQGEWAEQWPQLSSTESSGYTMPLAVEVVLELDEWGSLRRLIPTVGGGLDMQHVTTDEQVL